MKTICFRTRREGDAVRFTTLITLTTLIGIASGFTFAQVNEYDNSPTTTVADSIKRLSPRDFSNSPTKGDRTRRRRRRPGTVQRGLSLSHQELMFCKCRRGR